MKKGHKMSEYELACHHWLKHNGRMTAKTVKRFKARFHNECAICGLKDKNVMELHHIIPLGIGGKNDINNLVCLCANCHRRVHSPMVVAKVA